MSDRYPESNKEQKFRENYKKKTRGIFFACLRFEAYHSPASKQTERHPRFMYLYAPIGVLCSMGHPATAHLGLAKYTNP